MAETYNIGTSLPEDRRYSCGIGYIALPKDLKRDDYLKDCYLNYRVSMHTEHDGFINRVMINTFDINFIEFPSNYKEKGTPVAYITDPIYNQSIIVAILPKTDLAGSGRENLMKIFRRHKDSLVEISGNPEKGFMNLIVNSNDNAEMNIKILNKNLKGKLNIQTLGDVNVDTNGTNNFKQTVKFYSTTYDPKDKDTKTEIIQEKNTIKMNTPELKVNDGKENWVLGQKFKSFMKDFIKELAGSTTATMMGTQPLINAANIAAFEQRIDEFLSSIGFIDK